MVEPAHLLGYYAHVGRNRVVGFPLEARVVSASVTTSHETDIYAVNAALGAPAIVTLDPNAVDGDQCLVQDLAGISLMQPILVQAHGGIYGLPGPYSLAAPNGQAGFTFVGSLAQWVLTTVVNPRSTTIVTQSDLTALRSVDDTSLPDNAEAFVSTMSVPYRLSKHPPSAFQADPSAVKYVAAKSGLATWIQSDDGHAYWRQPRTWYVDTVTGDDENPGTLSSKMQTVRGACRKLGMGRRPRLPFATVIDVVVDPATMTFSEDVLIDAELGGEGLFQIVFHPVVVQTGTIDATHFNLGPFAPGEQMTVHDSANLAWGPFLAGKNIFPDDGVHYRVDITSGPASGHSFWIFKDLGAGTARVTYPAKWQGEEPGGLPTTCTSPSYPMAVPFNYSIVRLPYVTGAIVDEVAWGDDSNTLEISSYSHFEIHDAAIAKWKPHSWAMAYGCWLGYFHPAAFAVVPLNCVFGEIFYIGKGVNVSTYSGGFLNLFNYVNEGGIIDCDEGPIFQNVANYGQTLRGPHGLTVVHERGGFFDLPQPWTIQTDDLIIGSGGIFGQGNTTAIFKVGVTGRLFMSSASPLAATTTAAVEIIWETGNGGTSTKARPYTSATGPSEDTLGELEDTTFATVVSRILAGGHRRTGGAGIFLANSQDD